MRTYRYNCILLHGHLANGHVRVHTNACVCVWCMCVSEPIFDEIRSNTCYTYVRYVYTALDDIGQYKHMHAAHTQLCVQMGNGQALLTNLIININILYCLRHKSKNMLGISN